MSLLDAVNEVADVVSLTRFSAVVGNTRDDAKTMLALASEAGDEIARRVDWQKLLMSATINAAPFAPPADFNRLAPGAAIRTALGIAVRPVTNGSEWATLEVAPSTQPFFHRRGDKFEFLPLDAAVNASFNYVSAYWAVGELARSDAFRSDSDKTVFPERLLVGNMVWRWRRQKGLDFSDQLAEFEAALAQEIRADRGLA